MIKIASLPTIGGALLACGLSAAPAEAGPNRTWVSGTGTDSGACTRAAPCKTFAFALTQTAAGGEIDVLDPAGYGTVTITKAISIVNDGVGVAAIFASSDSGIAITINAGATDSVHLRGLTLNGVSGGGILFNTGGNLAIENCVVLGAILITPSTSSSFSVSNTIVSGGSNDGIVVGPTGSAGVTGVLSKVTAVNSCGGIAVSGSFTNVTIVDSEASNNKSGAPGCTRFGVNAEAGAIVMLRNSVVSYNDNGLDAIDNAILRVTHSVVTGNGTGVSTSGGGIIKSYGDNDMNGNTNNNFGALTTIPMH